MRAWSFPAAGCCDFYQVLLMQCAYMRNSARCEGAAGQALRARSRAGCRVCGPQTVRAAGATCARRAACDTCEMLASRCISHVSHNAALLAARGRPASVRAARMTGVHCPAARAGHGATAPVSRPARPPARAADAPARWSVSWSGCPAPPPPPRNSCRRNHGSAAQPERGQAGRPAGRRAGRRAGVSASSGGLPVARGRK